MGLHHRSDHLRSGGGEGANGLSIHGKKFSMRVERRVALLAAAAAVSKSSQLSSAALPPLFNLELPPGFVRLGNLGSRSSSSGYLLVAGDFRDTIGAGSATTSAYDACSSFSVYSDQDRL